MAKLDEMTNAISLVDSATFTDGSLAPESSKSTVAKVLLLEKVLILLALCYMKMAIDKVISSHPLEFREVDPVSTRWVVGWTPRPCSLISRRYYVVTLRWS